MMVILLRKETRKTKKGGLWHKSFALFVSALLALTCLPILPGSMKEAQAETVTGTITVPHTDNVSASISFTGLGSSATVINDEVRVIITAYVGGSPYTLYTYSKALSDNTDMFAGGFSDAGTVPVNISKIHTPSGKTMSLTGTVSFSFSGRVNGSGNPVTEWGSGTPVARSWNLTFSADGNSNNFTPTSNYGNPSTSGSVTIGYNTTTNQTTVYNPIVTAPNLEKSLGDVVSGWNEGVTATWGKTIANTIPSMGTIVDNTLVSGNDSNLSSGGTLFDKVGVRKHDYTVRDSTPDTSFTNKSRNIIVRSLGAPAFDITYAAGALDRDGNPIAGNTYNGEWTNQALELDASHTDSGTYETVIRKYEPFANATSSNEAVDTTNAHSVNVSSYQSDSTTTAGTGFTSILQAEDPMSPGNYIDLSPESSKQTVKIDTVNPTPAYTLDTTTNTFSNISTDALSGIDTARTKIAVVADGVVPTESDYTAFPLTINAPGTYDVWVWAWDTAGNNTKQLVGDDIVIKALSLPVITGATAGPDTYAALATGTWTNQDVAVTVTPPTPEIGGNYYSALYAGVTQEAKAVAIQTAVSKTYTGETTSMSLHGTLVDVLDAALSGDTALYEVKIDKTNPTGALSFNAGSPDFGFSDTSTDTLSPVGANSGVDSTKTVVAVVPAGDPEPQATDYANIAGEEIPSTGWWDVWVKATDIAGNESVPALALEHISRSGKDEIAAKDFAWDIATGSASFTDAMTKMLSHVEGIPFGSNAEYALSSISVDGPEMAAIIAAVDAGQTGTSWPLTFKTPAGSTQATTTIQVTLFDSGPQGGVTPPPGPLTQELIYGNNFNWGISTGSVDDNSAKTLSQVIAYDAQGNSIPASSLTVDSSELAAINAAIAAGQKDTEWPLSFATPDGTTTTVQVTLFDNGPVTPPAPGQEQIVGNDFAWGISSGSVSDTLTLFLAHASATSATGAPMPQSSISVDTAEIAAINAAITAGEQGRVLPLTLTTDGSSGASATTTVQVTLYDNGPTSPAPAVGQEHVVGNNFNWGISTGALDSASSLVLSSASATSAQGTQMPLTEVSVSATDLAAINAAITAGQKGSVWPLTLTTLGSTGSAASTVVQVTLFDNGPAPLPALGSEHIVGNNFNWGISTGALDKASAQVLSLLSAVSGTGTDINLDTVSMDAGELAAINTAISSGQKDTTWPLTFNTDGATGTAASVTVQVTLYDNGPAVLPILGSEHIVGNNFNWGIDSGALSDLHALHLGRIQGTAALGSVLPSTDISCDTTELAAINAAIAAGEQGTVWPLTFTTAGNTGTAASVTIQVVLYHAGHQTPVPGSPHIVANHFSRSINAGALSDSDAKLHSLVAALQSDGTAGAHTDISVDPVHLSAINAAIAAGDASVPAMPLAFSYTCPQTAQTVSAQVLVNLLGASDISVEKTVDNTNPLPGDTITYTITVKNNGTSTAQGLWIKDNVPDATTFVSCDSLGLYGATLSGKEYVNWYFSTLAVGQQEVLTLKVKVNECSPGTKIENVALYEEGLSGLPVNLDNDPQGGHSNSANSIVDGTHALPRTGDILPLAAGGALCVCALLALLILVFAKRRTKKEGQ